MTTVLCLPVLPLQQLRWLLPLLVWESGNVSMTDVREAVAKFELFNVDMHQIVAWAFGSLSAS